MAIEITTTDTATKTGIRNALNAASQSDINLIASISANWNSVYTTVNAGSAFNVIAGGNSRGADITIGTNDAYHFRIETNNNAKVTILSSGDVGIGTTLAETEVAGSGGLRIKNNLLVGGNTSITGTVSASNFRQPNTSSIGIGENAALIVTGINNVAVGVNSLSSNTTGQNNTAVGSNSLLKNSTSSGNTAFGSSALRDNNGGNSNSAFGVNSLQNNSTGSNNTSLGVNGLLFNSTGFSNVAVGVDSLRNNLNGFYNAALGVNSLYSNTVGNSNTSIGIESMKNSLSGSANSVLGFSTLLNNISGIHNSAIGYEAGKTIVSGDFNTLLGSAADVDTGSRKFCVCIGRGATSPAVNGSLAIGGTGGNAMGNLLASSGGTSSGQDLVIYLNGTRYLIALKT